MRTIYAQLMALVGGASFIGGLSLGNYDSQNKVILEYDINNDNRPDLILKDRKNRSSIFLRQEDGSLKRIDEVKSEIEGRAYSELEKITSKESSN